MVVSNRWKFLRRGVNDWEGKQELVAVISGTILNYHPNRSWEKRLAQKKRGRDQRGASKKGQRAQEVAVPDSNSLSCPETEKRGSKGELVL